MVACSQETSTEQIIAKDEIKQNSAVDLFIFNFSVYKKVRDLKVEEIDLNNYSEVGKISKTYSGEGKLEENMATKLPVGTKIYRNNKDSQIVIVKNNDDYTLYESIPEG